MQRLKTLGHELENVALTDFRRVEHGSSVVECRTRNRDLESRVRITRFEMWAFAFSPQHLSSLICINEYLAIDSGGYVSEKSSSVIAAWLK